MKDVEITVGLRVTYNGSTIEWSDGSKLKQGKYVVSRVGHNVVFLKSDRKNATTEYRIYKGDFNPKQLGWEDVTDLLKVHFFTSRLVWVVTDEELIKKAKKYNKNNT